MKKLKSIFFKSKMYVKNYIFCMKKTKKYFFHLYFFQEINSKDENQCPICFEEKKSQVSIPCGHCYCTYCIKQIRFCAICRNYIVCTNKVYI